MDQVSVLATRLPYCVVAVLYGPADRVRLACICPMLHAPCWRDADNTVVVVTVLRSFIFPSFSNPPFSLSPPPPIAPYTPAPRVLPFWWE